jgi:phosphohistidine phosphatase
MKLYLMRHGPADDQSPSGQDSDRALTASGRSRVRNVARALVDLGEAPLHIISSHLVRAVQTAEIVAVATKLSEREGSVEVHREMAPGGEAVDLTRKLATDGRRRVMLVGHEPDLTGVALVFIGRLPVSFDKAMVVGLQLASDGAARLRFVLDPKTLRVDPDARRDD